MIQHTVVFNLKHPQGSAAELGFLQRAKALGDLPDVIDLKVLRQIGKKNDFTFGLSMYFESEAEYQAYNDHPEHIKFVNQVWLPEVVEFLEIDYEDADLP